MSKKEILLQKKKYESDYFSDSETNETADELMKGVNEIMLKYDMPSSQELISQGISQGINQGMIRGTIETALFYGADKRSIINLLVEKFLGNKSKAEAEAEEWYNLYNK